MDWSRDLTLAEIEVDPVLAKDNIALVTGNGGAQAATFPALVPEIRNPPDRGATLWVFELTAPQQTPGRRN